MEGRIVQGSVEVLLASINTFQYVSTYCKFGLALTLPRILKSCCFYKHSHDEAIIAKPNIVSQS